MQATKYFTVTIAGFVSGALGALIVLSVRPNSTSPAVFDTVETKEIRLVGSNNEPRIVLLLTKEGNPRITLRDAAGKDRLTLGTSDDGSLIRFDDPANRTRLLLAEVNEVGELFFYDNFLPRDFLSGAGKPHLEIVAKDYGTEIIMNDSSGNMRLGIITGTGPIAEIPSDDSPRIFLDDAEDRRLAILEQGITFYGKGTKEILKLP